MEGYATKSCHLGINNNFIAICTPPTLRTIILLKGDDMLHLQPQGQWCFEREGVLGYYPDLPP